MRNIIELVEGLSGGALKNPTREQTYNLIQRSPQKVAKGLIDRSNGDLFLWDAFETHHRSMAKQLGVQYGDEFIIACDGATLDRETFTPGHVLTDDGEFALQLYDEPALYNQSRNFRAAVGRIESPLEENAPTIQDGTEKDGHINRKTADRMVDPKGYFHPKRPKGSLAEEVSSELTKGLDLSSYEAFMSSLQRLPKPQVEALNAILTHLRDEAKKPLQGLTELYHGAPHSVSGAIKQDGFKLTQGERNMGFLGASYKVDNQGVFLTDSKAMAHYFGSNRSRYGRDYDLLPCFVDTSHIVNVERIPKKIAAIGLHLLNTYYGGSKTQLAERDWWWVLDQPKIVEALKAAGYTGVRFREEASVRKEAGAGDAHTYLIFDPSTIKQPHHYGVTIKDFYQRLARGATLSEAMVTDLKGNRKMAPRVFYRGTNPGDTRRIRTGDTGWDSYLFAADSEAGARCYGDHVEIITAKADARIVYEGTAAFRSLAKGISDRKMNMLQWASLIAERAKDAGYDAVWFKRQTDIGTAILNPGAFVRGI